MNSVLCMYAPKFFEHLMKFFMLLPQSYTEGTQRKMQVENIYILR